MTDKWLLVRKIQMANNNCSKCHEEYETDAMTASQNAAQCMPGAFFCCVNNTSGFFDGSTTSASPPAIQE